MIGLNVDAHGGTESPRPRVKRVARPDDVSADVGNSEDLKVTHLQISGFIITNMDVLSDRYKNIDTLELFDCELRCGVHVKPWVRKRKLIHITCTPAETADIMFMTLFAMNEVEDVTKITPTQILVTWHR